MAVSVRLDSILDERLEQLAKVTSRSKSYYIRKAIEEKIEEMEDLYLSLQRLENPGKTWSLEQLERGEDFVEH